MAHELLSKHVNTWSQPLAIPCENVEVKLIYIHVMVDLVFLALCSVRIFTRFYLPLLDRDVDISLQEL